MRAATPSHDQGISRAGNDRLQSVMVQLAWSWVHWQPQSALARWYQARFGAGKRTRKVGIVALARKLLIALWRWATQRHRADRRDRAAGVTAATQHTHVRGAYGSCRVGDAVATDTKRVPSLTASARDWRVSGGRATARASDRRRARSHDRTLAPTTREAGENDARPSRDTGLAQELDTTRQHRRHEVSKTTRRRGACWHAGQGRRRVEVRGRLGENATPSLTAFSPSLPLTSTHRAMRGASIAALVESHSTIHSLFSSCRLRELRAFVLNPLSSHEDHELTRFAAPSPDRSLTAR